MVELTQAYMMQVGAEDRLDVGKDVRVRHDFGDGVVAERAVEGHPVVVAAAGVGMRRGPRR